MHLPDPSYWVTALYFQEIRWLYVALNYQGKELIAYATTGPRELIELNYWNGSESRILRGVADRCTANRRFCFKPVQSYNCGILYRSPPSRGLHSVLVVHWQYQHLMKSIQCWTANLGHIKSLDYGIEEGDEVLFFYSECPKNNLWELE